MQMDDTVIYISISISIEMYLYSDLFGETTISRISNTRQRTREAAARLVVAGPAV